MCCCDGNGVWVFEGVLSDVFMIFFVVRKWFRYWLVVCIGCCFDDGCC